MDAVFRLVMSSSWVFLVGWIVMLLVAGVAVFRGDVGKSWSRCNPLVWGVPSDLGQMSHLLNFLESQGNASRQRDSIASQMIQILEDAEFKGKAIDPATASSLIQQANQLLQQLQ